MIVKHIIYYGADTLASDLSHALNSSRQAGDRREPVHKKAAKISVFVSQASASNIAVLLGDYPFIDPILKCKRKYGVHPINRYRKAYREFHHLYKQLKIYLDGFLKYARMSINTFYLILPNKIGGSLVKKLLCYKMGLL